MIRATIFFLCISLNVAARNFYVSSQLGSDNWTLAEAADNSNKPFRSIDKINAIFAAAASASFLPGDKILFRRGDIFYGTLEINKSGSSTAPITIGAYGEGGGTQQYPTITGMKKLNWTETSTGSHIWLSDQVLTTGTRVWCVTKNNKIIAQARWPRVGIGSWGGWNHMNNPLSVTSTTLQTDEWTTTNSTLKPPSALEGSMVGSEIVMRSSRFWINRRTIETYDDEGRKVTWVDPLSATDGDVPDDGEGYFIQNNPALCYYQDAWYFEAGNDRLRIWSSSQPQNIEAANLDNLIETNGESWIVIDNVRLYGCNKNAILASGGGGNITLQYSLVENIGINGMNIKIPNVNVLHNVMQNIQCLGVFVSGSSGKNGVVKYNEFKYLGQLNGMGQGPRQEAASHDGCGVYLSADGADGWDIQNNRFIVCGYSAVNIKRQDHIKFNYNYVDTTDNQTDDGGAVYWFNNNTSVRTDRECKYNIIKNGIGAPYGLAKVTEAGAGVAGIYFDKETNHVDVQHNYIENFEKGMFANFGCDNLTLQYNTTRNCFTDGIQVNTRSENITRNLNIQYNTIFISELDHKAIVAVNQGDNLTSFGIIDNNYYIKPLVGNSTSNTSMVLTESGQTKCGKTVDGVKIPACVKTAISIATWRNTYKYDVNTKLSPFKYSTFDIQEDSTLFKYNDQTIAYTGTLPGTWQDLSGNKYNQQYTLDPFNSLVLFKAVDSGEPPPPPPPPPPPADGFMKIQLRKHFRLH